MEIKRCHGSAQYQHKYYPCKLNMKSVSLVWHQVMVRQMKESCQCQAEYWFAYKFSFSRSSHGKEQKSVMAMLNVNLNNILANSIWNQFLMFGIRSWQDKWKSHGNVKQNTALLKRFPSAGSRSSHGNEQKAESWQCSMLTLQTQSEISFSCLALGHGKNNEKVLTMFCRVLIFLICKGWCHSHLWVQVMAR